MWEPLASSRRQDRLLHGPAKAVNLVLGLMLLPAWLIGQQLSRPIRRLIRRVDGEPRALPVPPERERSMDALMRDLHAIPHRLAGSRTVELRKGLADFAPFILAQHRRSALMGYGYPSQFREDYFEGADGERIGATMALHTDPRPAVIVVHGLFSSHRFDYVREIAVRAYYYWGFNVAAVDLRSFGLTDIHTRAPSTGGWKEGGDVVGAARHLKELGATSVGALGISLGASAVLNAATAEGAAEALDGGVLAVCGPADTRMAAERLGRRVPARHPAYLVQALFRAMLLARIRNARWPLREVNFTEPIDAVASEYYGVSGSEIWRRSSALNHIDRARVPVLALHSRDDMIIPVKHAKMLAEAARDNPNVRVWIVPGGAHAAFDVLDKAWTYCVYRSFFEHWGRYGDPESPELIYSPRQREGSLRRAEALPRAFPAGA